MLSLPALLILSFSFAYAIGSVANCSIVGLKSSAFYLIPFVQFLFEFPVSFLSGHGQFCLYTGDRKLWHTALYLHV